MKFIKGYWNSYSYVVVYKEGDKEKKMEFVSEQEAYEYFK